MKTAAENFFSRTVAAILLITAAAKLYSALGSTAILKYPDPLFGFANRYVMLLASAAEIVIALILLRSFVSPRTKYVSVLWLACTFMIYHVAKSILHVGTPCPCLGTLTQRLHLTPATADTILSL